MVWKYRRRGAWSILSMLLTGRDVVSKKDEEVGDVDMVLRPSNGPACIVQRPPAPENTVRLVVDAATVRRW